MNATTETSDSDTDTDHLTTTARVAIRVPRSADATLVTAAEGRLDRADGVVGATIEAVHAVEPGLSATHVTATATIELAASTASAGRAHLADTLGVDVLESDGRQEADSA
jgi:hypothetical protein